MQEQPKPVSAWQRLGARLAFSGHPPAFLHHPDATANLVEMAGGSNGNVAKHMAKFSTIGQILIDPSRRVDPRDLHEAIPPDTTLEDKQGE